MEIKRSILGALVDSIRDEIFVSTGPNKFLLFTLFTNIPSPFIFIPYVTQAVTIVFLCFYLANISKSRLSFQRTDAIPILELSLIAPLLIIVAIFLQLFWIPFMTQLYTLALVGLSYALSKFWKK